MDIFHLLPLFYIHSLVSVSLLLHLLLFQSNLSGLARVLAISLPAFNLPSISQACSELLSPHTVTTVKSAVLHPVSPISLLFSKPPAGDHIPLL